MRRAVLNFQTLTFGAPAAERDIDVGLADYFVESEVYRRVAHREKTIVLGNRGTGKSAIFKVLAARKRRERAVVLELSPEDYSYEMLQSVLVREEEGAWRKHGAFAAAWKYLIFVLIMKGLMKDRTPSGEAAKKIRRYLRDNHYGMQDTTLDTLISYLKRIEGFKIGRYEATAKTRELTRLYKLEEIQPLIQSLVELCGERRVYVFVDELDRGWDASEDAKAFVAGLFQACVSINELTQNLTVYVSLRQELYENIPALYDDAQKYRDIIETIRWDEESLLSLVARRIRHAVSALGEESDSACWNAVFAEVLDYRKSKSFNYLIDRTLYRPREIIQFCTQSLDEAHHQEAFPIDYSVISRAELPYSESRTKDIAAEYRFQYPGLLSIFEVFRGRTYAMEREELELTCLGITTTEHPIQKAAEWVHGQDHELLIDILWRVGFLRALAVGGLKALRRSGSSYVGPHQISHLNLGTISRFQVHPMFRSYLGMKEPKGRADFD